MVVFPSKMVVYTVKTFLFATKFNTARHGGGALAA